MNGNRETVEAGHHGGEAWASRMVAVFVPPAILDEMQVVFHLPVAPCVTQQSLGRHVRGVETGNEVAYVVRYDLATGCLQLAIHAQRNAASGQLQCFADVVGVL